jgi:STE24 endopeptidase
MAKTILILFFIFFGLNFVIETLLELLNKKSVKQHRKSPPGFISRRIKPEDYTKAADYTVTKTNIRLISSAFTAAVLAAVILTGLFGRLEIILGRLMDPGYLFALLYLFIIGAAGWLISVPFSLYSQFVIEERYGFNTMTPKIWITDTLKSFVLSALIGVPLILVLRWFLRETGEWWWILAFGFYTVLQLFILYIYPVAIAPLFNKFRPLEDGELKEQLENLAAKLDFEVKGISVMDGSKRSKHSNAYFTGFGKNRRIVLYDTLVERLSPGELAGVLAHEIGHRKKHHITRRMILSLTVILGTFFLIHLLKDYQPLYTAFGFSGPSFYGILLVIGICSGPFTLVTNPLMNAWSRKHEYESDTFAAEHTSPGQLKEALFKLAKDNLTNPVPHPLYSFYHYSHPAVGERVAHLEQLENRTGDSP